MKKILITGGAGYKGVILTEELLKRNYHVTILDNFMYDYYPALGFASEKNCTIIKKDIRNLKKNDLKHYDVIYHLAAISGYPACEANPHSAQMINVNSTKALVKMLSKHQALVYASTTSLYGQQREELDENSPPKPVSLYGVTKYQAEKICMQRKNSISLRFATLFGVSRKMRFDLLLNDFVYKACNDRSIVLFDAHSVRTFLHVRDAIQAYILALENSDGMFGRIYNVGSNKMNYSKLELAELIKNFLPDIEIIQTQLKDLDKRNLVINFDKINSLGFKQTISINEGIEELINLYTWCKVDSTFRII